MVAQVTLGVELLAAVFTALFMVLYLAKLFCELLARAAGFQFPSDYLIAGGIPRLTHTKRCLLNQQVAR